MSNTIKIPQSNKKPLPDISNVPPPSSSSPSLTSMVNEEPVDLINLLVDEEGNKRVKFPDDSIKNRAAYAALLSASPNLSETYQSIVSENQQGSDYTRSAIMDRVRPLAEADMRSAAISALADPSLSIEQKKQVVNSMNDGFTKEPSTILANAAYAAPSKGETVEAEDVRISGAELFRSTQAYNNFKQGVRNRTEAIRGQNGNGKFVAELVEGLIPFTTNINAATNLTKVAEELKLNSNKAYASILPGEFTYAISEAVKNMPADKRLEFVQKRLMPIIENSNGIIMSENQMNALDMIHKVISGDYSNWGRAADNVIGVVDALSFGGASILKGGFKWLTSKVARTPEKVEQKLAQRSITNPTSPIAPLSVLREANPEKAGAALSVIVKSEGDEVAQALAGTSRTDAIASEMLPQPSVVDKTVEVKIIDPDKAIKEAVDNDGGYRYTLNERDQAVKNVSDKMEAITGLKAFDNMTTIAADGDSVVIRGMYGLPSGGFKNSEEAFNQARFALKDMGVADNEIQIFKRIDGEYVPISREEAKLAEGDYTIGIDFRHKILDHEVGDFEALDVRLNWLDRYSIFRSKGSGTPANHLMTHASMLHPTITGSASVAVDKAVKIDKLFLEMHSKFSDEFVKLPKQRQAKLYDHLKEANEKGLELSDLDLRNNGFHQHEISLVHQWRKNWDTHFYFENADVVRTLRNQQFQVFDDAVRGDKFFAKPIHKNGNISQVYDPTLGQVRSLSRLEMDQLYNSGGTYAQFRRPVTINGVEVEHMMVRNTPKEYLRSLTDHDQVLNYRKGYFQVGYKAPHFIEEKVVSAGKEYWKAVQVAGSTEEAEHIVKRLATSNGKSNVKGVDYNIRNDIKDFRADTDYYWDLQHASGRIAQRHRGKLLEDFTSHVNGFDGRYVLDPVESAIRASRSLSGRIAMRDLLETHKARAIQQYGDVFPKEEGLTKWVENSNSLVKRGEMDKSHIADARTTVEYINFLQRGYENAIDQGFKGAMNYMAELMAKAGSRHMEQAFLWAKEGRPVDIAKNGVFQAYLATNPFRQFLVQSHQAVRLIGYIGPKALGEVMLDAGKYLMYKHNPSAASKETQDMIKFVQDSGMLDAIDKHNLTAGSLTDMAEGSINRGSIGSTITSGAKKAVGLAFAVPRRLGFDAGEGSSLIMHIIAVRKKYMDAGKNIADKYVRDEIYSTARALSYDMNRAGDMPYNSNVFGVALQFLQVPHKAVAAVTTNRRIPVADRLRMFAMDTVLFGVPGGIALDSMLSKDVLPKDPTAREAAVFGLTSVLYNKTLQKLGADSKSDFSSLSPYGMDGFARLFEAILTGGVEEFWTNSPSATFYFNANSRMREAFSRVFKYMGLSKEDPELTPESAISVLKGIGELSSGLTNLEKAWYILNHGKLLDKQGVTLASNLNWVNAAAQAMGIPPMEVKLSYDVLKAEAKDDKELKEKVDKWYKDFVRGVAREGAITAYDPEMQIKILQGSARMWEGNIKAQRMISGYLARDLVDMQDKIAKPALENAALTNIRSNPHLQNLRMLNKPEYDQLLLLEEDIGKQNDAIGK